MLLSPKEQQRYLIITQAVINLVANTPQARTIVAHHKHSPVAGLIEAAPIGLALLEALIHFALYFHKIVYSMLIGDSRIGAKQAATRKVISGCVRLTR
jgi:hypothetical protein